MGGKTPPPPPNGVLPRKGSCDVAGNTTIEFQSNPNKETFVSNKPLSDRKLFRRIV
ncbi:hypothetical protein LZ31DRAFT_550237 [Colletotrichum somersetense]|nr:hypothetical protein LZ31DRAFT_550237 [Colletotrichum somersetense]